MSNQKTFPWLVHPHQLCIRPHPPNLFPDRPHGSRNDVTIKAGGGRQDDIQNYVDLLSRLRVRLDRTGRKFGLCITLPSSFWYLQAFDISNLEPYVDWFNVMTYDIRELL